MELRIFKTGGVTLIEMLTVIGLLALLGTVLAFMFGSMDQSYRNVKASLDVYQNARVTLARMNREISTAVFDNSGAAALGLRGSSNNLSFHAIYDADSYSADDTSSDVAAIRYAFLPEDGTVTRFIDSSDESTFPAIPVENASGSELAENIAGLSFEYFESAADFEGGTGRGNWDSAPGAEDGLPSLLRIRLTVKDSKGLIQPKVFETVVRLRNAI
ncbi:MAG: type II secretion system protein [Candidatus Omnitrophica bacterium]|nr:type II secretion system protein [Candidatus Omnitrophota bacterium]